MQEFPYVLSEYEEINPLLYKPINSTQRIKYTCFNTSVNYIVLGSTSGSIYLFSRKPCSFIQLIPLSQGAVSRVLISPDEKTIALTTTRGAVCLVALKPTPKLIATSTEHIHEQINCLCWNDNSSEIYIGDDNGIISVMVLSIFTVNSMFQAPASTLMNLDSAIVQLCFSSPLLLVSTLTRCYICDTVQEQYKQIGNKARNGEFGACFYKTNLTENKYTLVTQKEEKLVSRQGSFNFIPEGNSKVQEENFPQIFCARPGSRLWEVSANGIVIKTHQFKEALAMPPVAICRPNDRKSIYHKQTEQTWQPQSINFSHLFVVAEKYLFSYTSTGLYIIDPAIATVVLWNNEFSNINLAETIENKIYLMTSDGEFHCLSLSFLDSLILRLYNKKKYNECLEICLLYKVQLKKLVNNTEINNICDIENKLPLVRDDELPTLLHPLVILLESNTKIVPKKLESGIVVVNDGNSDLKNEEHFRRNSVPHCSLQNKESLSETELKIESKRESNLVTDSMNKMRKSKDTNCNTTEETYESKHAEVSETKEEVNSSKTITQRIQADLEVIYALVDNIRPSMDEDELEKIILDVDWKMDVIKDSYETLTELTSFMYEVLRSVELYYFNALLENISMQLIQSTDNENIIKQIMKAFININAQSYGRCTCKIIDEDLEQYINLCNKVPYMWREYLPLYTEQRREVTNEIVRQCLQIRDDVVLSILLPSLDRQNWNFVATYAKEIQDEQCLFCEKSMKRGNNEALLNWTAVIYEIVKKEGPDIAMTYLVKLEKALPNVPIDRNIFQSLIFTKLLYQHGMKCAINFNSSNLESSEHNTMCSTKIRDQLVEVLEKDLNKPINRNIFGNGPHHWGIHYQNKLSTCPCCTLTLQTPVLLGNNGIAIFSCGHAYHVNCMIEKKLTGCNLHS
ncbi:PREDICTED: LOW QUALITY PROTEIN: Hermansky-Pudlak syndrome 5 protein homolog [Habropoda laboriosa]|uniref:LOW QUALITY PROTEIN: Hermansky-Pudlak syndrome 5 protein homolog n=1 Tax=Habropoda laboriosa TaxID=597456 RepID=UPI00083DC3D9|nr:PREDICTED: LOW QUALITY PROTEIN: Hermansky-Pudlak syndrome 5 protein homolog [Habropoda laboriosa]